MSKLIAFFCLTLICLVQADERIVNGQLLHITKAPHLVQLRFKKNSSAFCGGTLITPSHVLTAAHCFDTRSPLDTIAVAEATTTSEVGVQRDVVAFIKSPEYSRETLTMDYAVLKLKSPMKGKFLRTMNLCSKTPMVGNTMQISGWGYTSHNGTASPQLRTMSAPLISQADCAAKHKYAKPAITSSMMCAFNPQQDICFGDSGGAGVVNGEICGIASWVRGCLNGYPSVYASVYTMRTQIENAVKSLR